MRKAYIVTGQLSDEQTVILDERVHEAIGRVRVILEPLAPQETRPVANVLEEIRRRQAERGFLPRTREEVDADLRREQDSWER